MLRRAIFLFFLSGTAFVWAQAPTIFYTDIVSGPVTGGQDNNGAFVTLYGARFGAAQGNGSVTIGGNRVAGYPIWTDTKVTIQLGPSAATGKIVLSNANGASNGVPFTVSPGNIYFVATTGNNGAAGSYSAPWLTLTHARDTIHPGDIVYAMNGVTQATDDGLGWNSCFTLGSNAGLPGAPKAIVAYPGASATIGSIDYTANKGCNTGIRAKGGSESYWTFAGLNLRGGSIAVNPYQETGWRLVANDISCPNGNDQAGCVDLAYEVSLAMYGNNIHNVGTNLSPSKVTALYHGVYISEFNHGIDFGWNTIAYVQGCRGLQQNVNQGSSSYDLHIHDNVIHDTQCDGIVMTTVDPSKGPVELYNNLIYNTGTGPANVENTGTWTCVDIQGYDPSGYGPGSGVVEIYNNTFYGCGSWKTPPYSGSEGSLLWVNAGNSKKSVRLRNNIVYASAVSPYCADSACSGMTGSNNLFYGNGGPPLNIALAASISADPLFVNSFGGFNFHLESGSPAIYGGLNIPSLSYDLDGLPRPQGSAFDIGAYQYSLTSSPVDPFQPVAPPAAPATLSANSSSLSYGNAILKQSSLLTVTITNTGGARATLSSAGITAPEFILTAHPSYPTFLEPGSSAEFTVAFAPTLTGSASGSLVIVSDAANSPIVVALSGTGILRPAVGVGKKGGNGTGSSGSSRAITVVWGGGGATAGSDAILVLVYGTNGPYASSNVRDSAGNQYHLDATLKHPHTGTVYLFSCQNAAAASSVTVTPPSFGDFQIVALEYQGLPATGALDVVGKIHDDLYQSSKGTYNWSTNPSGPLAQDTELVLSINAEAYGNVSAYSANGYTQEILHQGPPGGGLGLAVLDNVVISPGSVTPSGTYTSTSGTWAASAVVTYRSAARGIALTRRR